MRKAKRLNYKKLFMLLSKKITGIFEKKKSIKNLLKKENKYVHFFKKLFRKRDRKLQNAKIAISSFVLFFATVTVVSFLVTNKETTLNGPEQNINYDFMHGSATGRDFLFEGETGHDSNLTINEDQPDPNKVLYSGTMTTSKTGTNNSGGREIIEKNTGNINTVTNITTGEIIKDPNVIILPTYVSKYIIRKLKEQINSQKILSETENKDCISPRGTPVKNGEFVISYTQRTDVNNLCNVEKRYCNDGILAGTYNQKECNENVKYEYQEAEVKSYIQKADTTYTQPNKPKNNSANFSIDGKINEKNIENTDRSYSQSGTQTAESKEALLKYVIGPADCRDPRGNIIKNGQFITAYKAPLGFIDLECKSEYRYCSDGKLGGSYSYQTCKYKDITYNDYLVGNTDTDNATALDLMEIVDTEEETNSEDIRTKIQSLFR